MISKEELRQELENYFNNIGEKLLPNTFTYEVRLGEIHIEGKSESGRNYGIRIPKR